jgi:hypothetical protein
MNKHAIEEIFKKHNKVKKSKNLKHSNINKSKIVIKQSKEICTETPEFGEQLYNYTNVKLNKEETEAKGLNIT